MSNFEHIDEDLSSDVWEEQNDIPPFQPNWWKRVAYLFKPVSKYTRDQRWMGYYQNIYKSQGPCVTSFKFLLGRHGFYNLPNPYIEGNPRFYTFCQDGITLADIDFVLGRWEEKFAPKPVDEKQSRFFKDNSPPPKDTTQNLISEINTDWEKLYRHQPHHLQGQSISMTEQNNHNSWVKKQKKWESDALMCLVMLFKSPSKNWSWITEEVHQDNIRLLCKIVYDNAPQSDRPTLLKRWKKVGWVTPMSQKWFK